MAITLTFDQPGAGIPAGGIDRGRTDIKSTGAIAATRAYPVTITVGSIPTGALVDVVLLDEPPNSNPLLTELAPETWTLEFDVGCWGPFRVRVTATASGEVVSSVTRRISIRSPGYHIDYPGLAERFDPNATAVPTVPSVQLTEMNEGSTNRPLVDFHRQVVEAIEGGVGGGGVIPDGSITEEKLAPELSDNLLRADGTIPFTGDQDAAGHIIHNVGMPVLPDDAVPLATVLAAVNRAGTRTPCRLVATTPITASNTQVIDSFATVNADRVLLTAQTSAVENGIYIANDTGVWLRSSDADSSEELLPGMVIFITAGTTNGDSGWILTTDAPILLGTSPLTFARFTGAAQVVAGDGLTKTANTLNVVAHTDASIVVSADAVQVGVLATDAQHGARGGGTQHAPASPSVAGFQSAADKTKLDGISSGAAALSSSAPANVGTAAAVGAGTTAARSDHVHSHGAQTDSALHAIATTAAAGFQSAADKTKLDGISSGAAALSSTTPAAVAFTGTVGVGTTAARSDHVHAHASQTDGTLHAAATTTVAGFQSAADKTKLDGISSGAAALTATAPTQITVTTAAAGVATVAAKGDHVHSVSTAAPSALTVGGAQSTGSATSLARSDHQHAMPTVATTIADGFFSAADKTRLDGIATGAAALTSTAPVAVDNSAAALGVGTTAARHDHRHTVNIGTPVALTVASANAQGTATTLARSDHTHATPALATTSIDGYFAAADKTRLDSMATSAAAVGSTTPVAADVTAAAVGVATTAARSDHRHQVTVGSPVALTVPGTAADGTSTALARADHKHAMPSAGTPVALTLAGANAPGSAATLALSDHVHALPATAAAVSLTLAGANAGGSAVTIARSDHLHALPASSTAPPALTVGGASAAGSSASISKADHVHALPQPIEVFENTGPEIVGVSTSVARADHQHPTVWKAPVVALEVSEVFNPATPPTTVDGVTISEGDRVLVEDSTLSGIYIKLGDGTWSLVETLDVGEIVEVISRKSLYTGTPSGGFDELYPYVGISNGGLMYASDYVKLGGIATGAAAVTSTAPTQITVTTAAAGASSSAARGDHVHSVATAAPSSLAIGSTQNAGSSTSLSRADHVHAMPGLATSSVSGFMASLDKLQFDGIKAGTPWAIAPSPAAPTAGTVSVLSSTASVSFPTAPADGDKITVLCVPGSTFNYTLTATPKAIRDPAGRTAALSATFSSFDGCITWMYSVVSSVWEVFSYYPTYAGALATDPRTNGFRLAANASDTFAADGSYSSIWLAPVNGDRIALYDIPTTTWRLFSTAALQYSLSGRSAGIPFDVFAYQTGGTVALEVQNWSSATVRATSIARRNGVWVMNADNTRRYIGTVRARSSTNYRIARAAASDVNSAGIDYWNVDNKQQTGIALVGGSTPTYAYATAAWRQAAALATAQIDVVAGIAGDPCFLDLIATATTTNATVVSCAVGIGINSTTTPSSRHSTTQIANAAPSIVQTQLNAHLVNMSPVGVTQYAWLEYGAASSSFVGINADTKHQPGMSALVWY